MTDINGILFQMINASANPPPVLLAGARFSAIWLINIAAIWIVLAWLRSGKTMRLRLFDVGVITVIALSINVLIAANWYHARPFELGIGQQLTPHAADTSFPSDHGTVLFAIAFATIAAGIGRLWQILALSAAVLTAWSRVYLGIHWPLDMAGSILIAVCVSLAARPVLGSRTGVKLKNSLLLLFDQILKLAHVPAAIIPRSFPSNG